MTSAKLRLRDNSEIHQRPLQSSRQNWVSTRDSLLGMGGLVRPFVSQAERHKKQNGGSSILEDGAIYVF